MRRLVMSVVVLTLALVAALGGAAYGAVADNAECLSCHSVASGGSSKTVEFSVGDVPLSACNACHSRYKHFEHPAVPTPCTNCHLGAKAGAPYYYSDTQTAYGYFSEAASLTKSAQELHAIHANGDWVATYFRPALGCGNCHKPASCSACHTSAVDHGTHSSTTYAPVTYAVGTGSATVTTTSSCINPACHALEKAASADFVPACDSCHATKQAHYDGPDGTRHLSTWTLVGCGGSGCHTTRDLMGAHTEKNPAFTCDGCHKDFSVAAQIQQGLTGCGDCHTSIYQSSGHRAVHWPSPLLSDASGPFYSYYSGSLGTMPTGDCTGCHTSNLVDEHSGIKDADTGYYIRMPRKDATGATLTCDSCHDQPAGSVVQQAIADSKSACESCHPVHGPINAVHTSTFVDSPEAPCAECHSANLTMEHNGGYQSTAGLTGCDVCHELYVGMTSGSVSGSATQAAISGGNDTRCSACHAAYHTNAAAHQAGSALSLACGDCHAAGAEVLDVTTLHPTCATCHKSTRIGEISEHTAECASCHAAEGTDYHMSMSVHVAPASSGCQVSGCHHNRTDVRAIHTCATCHADASDPGKTTACANCHATQGVDYHYDFDADHTPADSYSANCASCHETTDVRLLHETQSCNQCHYINGCTDCHASHMGSLGLLKTTGCAQCHNTEGETGNYHTAMDAGHSFTSMSEGCKSCHAQTLPEAHQPYLSRYTEYADTCALCHKNADPSRIDWATASADCSSCHTIHGDIETIHTPTASEGCVRCHDDGDVRDIHGDTVAASCAVCHNATLSLDGKTAECTTCHYEGGIAYHTQMAGRHLGFGTSGTCIGSGCHPSRDVSVVHERFVGTGKQYSQYPDTCALCHLNADSTRIDWNTTFDGTCFNCHGVAHDRMNHVATSTQSLDCAGCHDDWVPATHGADGNAGGSWAKCDTCHNNPTKGDLTYTKTDSDCEGCHDKYPSAEKHYPAAKHLTTHESPCTWCHYQDLKTEHAQSYVAVTCVQCHTVDKAVISAGWNKSCDECHMDMHGDKTAKHDSTRTDCSTSGCHLSDAAAIHGKLAGAGCQVCHSAVEQAAVSKNCTDAGCHGDGYHAALPGLHTATASASCTRCHDEKLADGSQLEPVHKSVCATCHNATIDLSTKTAECATCHVIVGTDYHSAMNAKHSYTAMDAGCQAAGCHLKTLPEEHAKYVSRYTGYADSCALCHLNADPARIPAGATAACSSCHTLHGDITEIHTAKNSQACVDCHETGLTLDIHKKTDGTTNCDMCHAAPAGRIDWNTVTIECTSCHGTLSPADPNHYPLVAHDASAETACNQCHYKDMKLEHFKPTVAVTCVACHEVKVDNFTGAWDKTCAACHPIRHGDQRTKHVSTTTGCGTAATGCHNIADAEAIHTQPGGPGCGACHKNPATPATTTNCTDAACHANVGTNHKALHDAAAVNPSGCKGCHFMNLVDEHEKLALTCGTCHDNPAYASVIAANDLRCKSCHPTMHSKQDYEFNPKMSGGHRVSAELPGMQSSFVVNSATYTWTLPTASSFLKTGWTTNSIVPCDGCHSYTGATGPHGATMTVNIDPAYPTNWKTAYLRDGTTLGMSSNTIICAKCHDLNGTGSNFSNKVHDTGDHHDASDGQCYKCHVQVPHGWGRPRLLGYTTDGAPYATATGGISKIALKNYTPLGWSDRDCYAACAGDHSTNVSNPWPNAYTAPAATTGNVSGTVKNASGAAISGATVSIGGKTATSSSTGAYSITGIATGAYTMSVTATGYNAWSGPVTIAANTTATQNVTMSAVVVTQYGNVSGTVKNASGAAISGATVSIGGKTATTSGTGAYSITGIATGAYTMSVTATGYNAWSGPVTITANTTATQNVTLTATATRANVARTGAASASSTYGSYSASRMIDGSTSTYWRSNSNDNQWFQVDLRATKTFDQVDIKWDTSRYGREYRIETSVNGSDWNVLYSETNGQGMTMTYTFPEVSARYVRVTCTRANYSYYRVNEFEVWGY